MTTLQTLLTWLRQKLKLKVSLREERSRRKLTEAEYWARCLDDVRTGRRPDPLMMSEMERHQATRALTARFKWSKDFAYRMKTPLLRQLKETGIAVNLIGTTPEVYMTEKEIIEISKRRALKATGIVE